MIGYNVYFSNKGLYANDYDRKISYSCRINDTSLELNQKFLKLIQ